MANSLHQVMFKGTRTSDGAVVQIIDSQGSRPLPLHLDLVNHSPTGFEWGYLGSGPHQLGFAMVLESLKTYFPMMTSGMHEYIVRRVYRDFTREFVSQLSATSWEIDTRLVVKFIEEHDASKQASELSGFSESRPS